MVEGITFWALLIEYAPLLAMIWLFLLGIALLLLVLGKKLFGGKAGSRDQKSHHQAEKTNKEGS